MKVTVSYALIAFAIGSRLEVTPVQKVITLMEKMLEKGKEEKHAERMRFAAHRQFCDDTTLEKQHAIAEADENLASLKADIRKYSVDATLLTREIAVLDEDISTWGGNMGAATNVRENEKADRKATKKSYSETIDALQHAAEVLKDAASDRKQLTEASLAQAAANSLHGIRIGHETSHQISTATTDHLLLLAREREGDALPRAAAVLQKAEQNRKQRGPLPRAAAVLKKAESDRKHREATWAQTMKTLIPDAARRAIDVFLQQGEDEAEDLGSIWYQLIKQGQHDTEFRSHDVIELLDNLSHKFIDERARLEKEETNSERNYAMLMQDLKAQIAQASTDRAQKTETKAKKLQAQADSAGELKDTAATVQDDRKYVSDLRATCEQTASAFKARQQLRADEAVAIERAIDIISGNAVAGNADKHLATLSQKEFSFAQLRANSTTVAQDHAIKYLQAQAAKLNSRVLASIPAHISHDPAVKVKKMIKDLIGRLVEEASEEADHKGWCDSELMTNEQTRKGKTDQVETLHAEIDELQASISKLTERIGDFTQAAAELDAAMVQATKLRAPDKAKNAETISDAQEAQTAVTEALAILGEFYAKAAKSTASVRQPEMPDSSYKGMQSETSGVVGMLEFIKSDFAQLESETKAAEVSAQQDYEEFMSDSKVDKSQKSADIEHNVAKRRQDSQTLTQKTADLEGAQQDLDAALAYFDKLKPSCTESGVGYEDRVGRRRSEIESLQIALRILNGQGLSEGR